MKEARELIERYKADGGSLTGLAAALFALPTPPPRDPKRSVADVWNDAEDERFGEARGVWTEIDLAGDSGLLTRAEVETLGDLYDKSRGTSGP